MPRPEPSSTRITRAIRAVYSPFHRLPGGDEGGAECIGGEGVNGGVKAGKLFIAPAWEDEAPCAGPCETGPPDADTEYGCQEVGGANCGVERTGATLLLELLPAAVTGGMPPLEEGDPQGEDVAKNGVEDGDMLAPI